MEEADVLGVRAGIMANRQLICVGSTIFLKMLYGTGHTLNLNTEDESHHNDIFRLFRSSMPDAMIIGAPATNSCLYEWSIAIPSVSCSTAAFPVMLRALQNNQQDLGIRCMGLSLTTIDDVFIKAG
jgi:ATP-binding cassette subfamily A (ABC1) protein 3